jgi:cellulose synthase/poly-beta-1,6-N-acetylglucosamine synthase-like glycosyltransferase
LGKTAPAWGTDDAHSMRVGDRLEPIACSVGVMAYNEAANIGGLLDALIRQRSHRGRIDEIIVLSSGCTDETEAIVRKYEEVDPRVRLIRQSERQGKASAINLFLKAAKSPIVILESADTRPEPDTIERLVAVFDDPEVGMAGARPVPVNDPKTFLGFAACLLWDLHHHIALRRPKMGELIAFRRVFQRIPINSAVDEVSIEALIRGQGYQLRYVPSAIVRNRGPSTFGDFVRQRRRIFAGHLQVLSQHGYGVPTMRSAQLLLALVRGWKWDWRYLIWTPGVAALEIYSRLLGQIDHTFQRRDHAVWEMSITTKSAIE